MLPLNNELEFRLLMPKISKAHKNYLTTEIWEEKHLREIFYGTLIFQQSNMICIGRHVGGHTLALQHGGQNYFWLKPCWTLDSYVQMCCKHYHIIFSTFPLKFKCKICVQKEVIRNLQNHIWSPDQLRAYSFKENVAGLKNQITFMLFRICPTNRFSKAKQNHVTFIFIKTMSHDALVQMA